MDYRQRIIEEAAVMFRTYGIRAVTMDMLATRLGYRKEPFMRSSMTRTNCCQEYLNG